MQPSTHRIGIELDSNERDIASHALEVAATMEAQGLAIPIELIGHDLELIEVPQGKTLELNRAFSKVVIAAAMAAQQDSTERSEDYRRNLFSLNRSHSSKASTQIAAIELAQEEENLAQFTLLLESSQQALGESEDIAITKGLERKSA